MELCVPLSLSIIITFFAIGAPQVTVCERDGMAMATSEPPHLWQHLLTQRNESFDGGGGSGSSSASSGATDGDGGGLMDNMPIISSEPTEYPLEFGNAKNRRQMSFGEAVVLSIVEATCLNDYGSQRNRTMGLGLPEGVLAETLIAPFGCFKPETSAQCEQCRNITAQPISRLDDCKFFCEQNDDVCSSTCSKLVEKLQNESKWYDSPHWASGKNSSEDRGFPPGAVPGTFYEDDSVNYTTSFISSAEIPVTLLQLQSSKRKGIRRHKLQSPQVFCEGVNYIDDKRGSRKKPSSSSLTAPPSEVHFVLLKWNINESGSSSKLFPNSSDSQSSDSEVNNEQTPLVFVVEQKSGNFSEWTTIGKTSFGLQTVNVSYHTNTYKWRITAVGPNGIEDVATTQDYVTLDGYQHPGPPKKIFVVKTEVRNSSVNVLIGWEPPDEKACFYKIVLEGSSGSKTETVRIKDQPLGVHMYWFEDLKFGADYHVRMTTRNPSWKYESNLTKLEFKTPTCLESFNYRFDKCVPPPPRDIKSVIESVKGEHSSAEQHVQMTLSWLPPLHASEENPIEKYLVEISTFSLNRPTISKINMSKAAFLMTELTRNFTISGNMTKLAVKQLKPDIEYTVMISAYSSLGRSPRAQYHFNTRLAVNSELPHETVGNWIYVVVAFTVAAVMLIVCNAIRIYVHKRNVKIARNQYFQSMEERDELGADWSIVPLTDDSSNWKLFDENFPKEKWEISWDHLTMAEVIGQGAFGIVRRAKIHRKKLEAKLKFRGDDEVWFNAADRIVDDDPDMETVAVKMVKVSPTRDDREQLIREITMMQSLGFHSQIVGLLGACTRGRTLCLVLEYCPGGDLLSFVRKVRAKYWPTLGLAGGSKMQNSPCTGSRKIGKTTAGGGMQQVSTSRTNSGSGEQMSGGGSSNRKSSDSSPINYADIGGFSESCSSPEASLPGFRDGESFKMDFTGNSARTENSIPPFFSDNGNTGIDDDDDDFRPIDERDVLSYARQIAMGMEYLEKNRVVHRDLACRNVLLMGDFKRVKISDFGLSRDIYTWNVYHQKSNGKLPIKWMAIESIFTHVFTTKSDVWSYGILLWELVTLGGTPYPGLGNTELFHLLKSGYRMERPDNCSEELYAVMKKCWRTAAASRPSFTELRRHVETMMEAAEPNLYLSLMADLPVDHFQLGSRSDIPLVGELSSPAQESPTGPTNPFSSHHISTTSNGGCTVPTDHHSNIKAFTPGVSSHNSRRKCHSLYRNTAYKNTDPESPCEGNESERFVSPDESSFSLSRKEARLSSQHPRRPSCVGTASHSPTMSAGSPSTPRLGENGSGTGREEWSHHPHHNHHQLSICSRNNSTSSHKAKKALPRLSLDFPQTEERTESCALLKSSEIGQETLLGSGTHNRRGQTLWKEDEQIEVDGDDDDDACAADEDQFSEDCCESPPPLPARGDIRDLRRMNGASRSRGKTESAQSQPFPSCGSQKHTLPFVNINDMTIIENKTYDLKDV